MSKKLKNAPLKEATFELLWSGNVDNTGIPNDTEFEIALGKFDQKIINAYPVRKRLIPANAPIKIFGRPLYQYWTGESFWPVVQFGPGVVTVNETNLSYDWEGSFRQRIFDVIDIIEECYERIPKFNKVALRYIDTIQIPDNFDSIIDFVNNNFEVNINNTFNVPGVQKGININQNFIINDGSTITFNIQTATNNRTKRRELIWVTSIEKKNSLLLQILPEWIDLAHTITSDLFVKTIKKELYESFDR